MCIQFSSVAQSCSTLCDPIDRSMPDFPVHHQLPDFAQTRVHWVGDVIQPSHPLSSTLSRSLLRFVSIESVMSSNHLVLCRPLLPLPSRLPSIRVFSNELAFCNRWPKYWGFSISPPNEYSGLISFRIDFWSPCSPRDSQESSPTLQFKSINSSVLSFLYGPTLTSIMTTGKTIALTIQIFVDQVMFLSLLFNILSRFVIAFLSRSKHLLILWLQPPSAVILDPPK